MESKALLDKILEIGIRISGEANYQKILEIIINESMLITNADAGTLYIKKGDYLHFMIMRNNTFNEFKGENGEIIDIPPVPMSLKNVCSYSALKRKTINIENVYTTTLFNFEGPKKYDAITGYHTQSMVVIPLIDKKNEVIGVLQLINAMDENGNVRAFTEEEEHIVFSIGSQSAILLSNMLLSNEVEEMLNSMADSLTTAIDSRTPYNANHSRNVARLSKELLEYAKNNSLLFVTDNDIEQIYMAGLLHDVGKIIIPIEVMDKATKLGDSLDTIKLRANYIKSLIEIDSLRSRLDTSVMNMKLEYIDNAISLIEEVNNSGYLKEEYEHKIMEYSSYEYKGVKLLTEENTKNLLIKKGTLNDDERKTVESHVVFTNTILSKIHFGNKYNKVIDYASEHHEYLDGSGYPNKLVEQEIPLCSRVLTMMDIYESLTAKDRPYKKGMPAEKAYSIVSEMAKKEGKLDENLVNILGEYLKDSGEL